MLQGKVSLITGASRGIGKAIAERYAANKAIVYANARKPGAIDAWAQALSAQYGTEVVPLYFDVTDSTAVRQALLQVSKDRQRLDVVINNAAVIYNGLLGMVTPQQVKTMFAVNVFAVMEITELAARLMARQNSGSIINLASIVGSEGSAGQVAYSASKGAVIALTKSAAVELAPKNIRVNAVAPGMTATTNLKAKVKEGFEILASQLGMGRLATPEDVANACVFLGSDFSSYITGEILAVDGGTSTRTRSIYDIEFEQGG